LSMLVFREMTTQTQPQKLSQCKRCESAGFPNIMISFIQNGVNKTTGKPFWDLYENGVKHTHRQKSSGIIESERPPPRPSAFKSDTQTTVATNGTAKDQVQERINQSHLENTSCWTAQTEAIREQTKVLNDLVSVLWEVVQK
jgi:hypothetical protein